MESKLSAFKKTLIIAQFLELNQEKKNEEIEQEYAKNLE